MKFDRSNKFDFCYYGQVNSLRLKSSVASKWASKHLWGNIYFAGDGTFHCFPFSCFENWKLYETHERELFLLVILDLFGLTAFWNEPQKLTFILWFWTLIPKMYFFPDFFL